MNLSGTKTVSIARYNLDRVEIKDQDQKKRRILEILLSQKHVMYDWGNNSCFVYPEEFSVNYEQKAMTTADGKEVENGQWIRCEPDTLHNLLSDVFEGEWGPTALDFIMRMEHSGVRVDICGTDNYGPQNPGKYIQDLRKFLKV